MTIIPEMAPKVKQYQVFKALIYKAVFLLFLMFQATSAKSVANGPLTG
jgi:hypothetical protein